MMCVYMWRKNWLTKNLLEKASIAFFPLISCHSFFLNVVGSNNAVVVSDTTRIPLSNGRSNFQFSFLSLSDTHTYAHALSFRCWCSHSSSFCTYFSDGSPFSHLEWNISGYKNWTIKARLQTSTYWYTMLMIEPQVR